jgi:hypothetical protein
VDSEDPATSFVIRKRKLDLPINPTWPNECRIQTVDSVGGHDHFHIAPRVKAIELILHKKYIKRVKKRHYVFIHYK